MAYSGSDYGYTASDIFGGGSTGALGSGYSGIDLGATPMDTSGASSAASSANIDWTNLLGGIGGLLGAGITSSDASKYGQMAALAADPFSGQRGQYQTMLANLMTNPAAFNLSPAATAQMNLGTQNLQRSEAARGFLGSGNILAELQGYGQKIASQDYYNQLQNLELLSGATTGSPAAAGQALGNIFSGKQAAQGQAGAAVGNTNWGSVLGGLGSLATGIGSLFGL